MDDNHVLVYGPHGLHMEVHKTTQASMPERFPLVGEKPSANADGKTQKQNKEPENGN